MLQPESFPESKYSRTDPLNHQIDTMESVRPIYSYIPEDFIDAALDFLHGDAANVFDSELRERNLRNGITLQ